MDEPTDGDQHAELSTAYEQLRSQVLGVNGKPPRRPGTGRLSGARHEGVDRGLSPVVSAHCRQQNSTLSTIDILACAGAERRNCSPHRHAVWREPFMRGDEHDAHQKVNARHLKRTAYLYVRQSTLRQVFKTPKALNGNTVCANMRWRLGWPLERIIVIDSDLGLSGASSDREGFRRLVTEVSLAHVGIVLGLEVSRLARNSTDWHRLLEICALTDTLILDEDGIYDPSHFNDRLLLGLKGTMSEAELHVIRARLQGENS